MRLKYWGYSQGENQHLLSPQGLTIRYKTYAFLPFSKNIRNYFRLKNLTYSDDALISIKNFLFMVNSFTSHLCLKSYLPTIKISRPPVLGKIFHYALNQQSFWSMREFFVIRPDKQSSLNAGIV